MKRTFTVEVDDEHILSDAELAEITKRATDTVRFPTSLSSSNERVVMQLVHDRLVLLCHIMATRRR